MKANMKIRWDIKQEVDKILIIYRKTDSRFTISYPDYTKYKKLRYYNPMTGVYNKEAAGSK